MNDEDENKIRPNGWTDEKIEKETRKINKMLGRPYPRSKHPRSPRKIKKARRTYAVKPQFIDEDRNI
jgi:hypothetical protein